MTEGFRSGFVALVGRPNVGKSTLLNAFLGRKVAIVSDKPQTTRNRILGIENRPGLQVIFVDTPGFHRPRHRLGQLMVDTAAASIKEVDLVLHVVDASVPPGPGDRYVAEAVKGSGARVFVILNKIDLLPRGEIKRKADLYSSLYDDAVVVPVSALKEDNVENLFQLIANELPEGEMYFGPDDITDQPVEFAISELIREKVLSRTRDEIPHSVAVEIEKLEHRREDLVYIAAAIYVERENQKKILVGRRGSLLKEVGAEARRDIEELLGKKAYLEIWVKVRPDWRDRPGKLRELGYRPDY